MLKNKLIAITVIFLIVLSGVVIAEDEKVSNEYELVYKYKLNRFDFIKLGKVKVQLRFNAVDNGKIEYQLNDNWVDISKMNLEETPTKEAQTFFSDLNNLIKDKETSYEKYEIFNKYLSAYTTDEENNWGIYVNDKKQDTSNWNNLRDAGINENIRDIVSNTGYTVERLKDVISPTIENKGIVDLYKPQYENDLEGLYLDQLKELGDSSKNLAELYKQIALDPSLMQQAKSLELIDADSSQYDLLQSAIQIEKDSIDYEKRYTEVTEAIKQIRIEQPEPSLLEYIKKSPIGELYQIIRNPNGEIDRDGDGKSDFKWVSSTDRIIVEFANGNWIILNKDGSIQEKIGDEIKKYAAPNVKTEGTLSQAELEKLSEEKRTPLDTGVTTQSTQTEKPSIGVGVETSEKETSGLNPDHFRQIKENWDKYSDRTHLWNQLSVQQKQELWDYIIKNYNDEKAEELKEEIIRDIVGKNLELEGWPAIRYGGLIRDSHEISQQDIDDIFGDMNLHKVDTNGLVWFKSREYEDSFIVYKPGDPGVYLVKKATVWHILMDNQLGPRYGNNIISQWDTTHLGDDKGRTVLSQYFTQQLILTYDLIQERIKEKENEKETLIETSSKLGRPVAKDTIEKIDEDITSLKKLEKNLLDENGISGVNVKDINTRNKEIDDSISKINNLLPNYDQILKTDLTESDRKLYEEEKRKLDEEKKELGYEKEHNSKVIELIQKIKNEKPTDETTPQQPTQKPVDTTQSAINWNTNEANKKNLEDFKKKLKEAGYSDEEIEKIGNGDTPESIEAIKNIQKELEVDADGKVGTLTLNADYSKIKTQAPVEAPTETPVEVPKTKLQLVTESLAGTDIDTSVEQFEDLIKDKEENKDTINAYAKLLGIEKGKLSDDEYHKAIKEALKDKNFVVPTNLGGEYYYKKEKASVVIPTETKPLLVYGSEVFQEGSADNIGSWDKDYSVLTFDVPQTKKSYYVSQGMLLFEVNIEGTGKNKVYKIANPKDANINDNKGDVYLMKNNRLFYNDGEDDIYSLVGSDIKSLTPIEGWQDGIRYTRKISKGKGEIVIQHSSGATDVFESSSGVAYTGIEYLEDKEGNVYIWSALLGAYVDEDGKPVTEKNKAATSTEFTKDLTKAGLFLDKLTYATSGYRGFSLFYDEPNTYGILDENMQSWLGGIDGWTSLLCQSKVTESVDAGIAMSYSTYGPSAHIEGEKIKVINYSGEQPTINYLYKISLEVAPGSEYQGCDMEFRVYVKEPARSVFRNSKTGAPYTFKAEKGNESVSYKGPNMVFKKSKYDYQKVCIDFLKLDGYCLAGISEGEELCNKIIDGGEKKLDLGEDPCDKYPMMINCWDKGETGSTTTSSSTTATPNLGDDW